MTELVTTRSDFDTVRTALSGQIGLVPTMGNLHQGHLSLLERSTSENDHSIVTIFVNPTQFGEGEDFESYPRTLETDIECIKRVNDKAIVFAPMTPKEIYNQKVVSDISAGEIGNMLEGNLRPGHFDGVLSVVSRLFDVTQPSKAYFGKKDYQQLKIISNFTQSNFPNIEIIGMPIIREESGLAMSSRNNYLSKDEKDGALKLYQALSYVEKTLLEEKDLKKAQAIIQDLMTEDDRFNYLSIRTQHDLTPPMKVKDKLVILGNYQMGNTRLLDNIEVDLI